MTSPEPTRPTEQLSDFWNAVTAGEHPLTSGLDPELSDLIGGIHRQHVAEIPRASFAADLDARLRARIVASVPGFSRVRDGEPDRPDRVAVLDQGPAWHMTTIDAGTAEPVVAPDVLGFQAPSEPNPGRDALYLADLAGDDTQMIAGASGLSAQHFDWSPDGASIVFVDDLTDSIWTMSLQTMSPVRLAECDLAGHFCDYPAWSPNGEQIAFTRYEGDGRTVPNRSTICVLNLRSGEVTICAESEQPLLLDVPRWSPDGTSLVIGIDQFDSNLFVSGSTIATLSATGGEPLQLLPFASFAYRPDWNRRTGEIVFSTETIRYASETERLGSSWNLFVISPGGRNHRQLTDVPPGTFLWQPTWTPDGSAVIATRDEGLRRTVVKVDPESGDVAPLFPRGAQSHARMRPSG